MQAFHLCCLLLLFSIVGQAQQTRYFQFTTQCGHGNWQDTAFVAATNDQSVIDSVLSNLNKPLQQRQFISGLIAAGNGGHNRNAGHWFKWHFAPNQWSLVDLAIEVCDGCPYTDVDADTAYWLNTIGQFCPWSGQPVREVSEPTGIAVVGAPVTVRLYPNPAVNSVFIDHDYPGDATITLFNTMGQRVFYEERFVGKMLNVRPYNEGVYWLHIVLGQETFMEQVVISK